MQVKPNKQTAFLLFIIVIFHFASANGRSRAYAGSPDVVEDVSPKIDELNELKMKQQFPAAMMKTLTGTLPDGAWLTRIGYSEANLNIEEFARWMRTEIYGV